MGDTESDTKLGKREKQVRNPEIRRLFYFILNSVESYQSFFLFFFFFSGMTLFDLHFRKITLLALKSKSRKRTMISL